MSLGGSKLKDQGRRTSQASGSAWLLVALLTAGCTSTGPAPVYESFGPAPPGYYRIRYGDTLYKIAARYKVGYKTLASWNDLGPPYRIYAGSLIRVEPPVRRKADAPSRVARTTEAKKESPATPRREVQKSGEKQSSGVKETVAKAAPAPAVAKKAAPKEKTVSGLRWRWPLEGTVVQKFHPGDRTRQGIRISGPPGQKVRAAEAGTVVYSGSGLKGYGNLIIVKHNNEYLSAYGFNRRLLVVEGTQVEPGQIVAEVGEVSGREHQLHFEIRRNGTAVDPLKYLP